MSETNHHPVLDADKPTQPKKDNAKESEVHQTERPPERKEGVVSDPDQYINQPASGQDKA